MIRVPFCFKTMLLAVSLVAGGLAPALAATARNDLPALGSEAPAHVLRGRFVQHKHLADLKQPLVSRGHYVVARDHGLLWQVEKPVDSTLVITPDALTERSQGRQTSRISAEQQPALGAVASVLLAVFQGNTKQLSRYFDIQRSGDDDTEIALTLTPKTDAVKNFISRLELSGDRSVRHIRIDQPGGDYSVIDLTPSDDTSKALTDRERRAFSH